VYGWPVTNFAPLHVLDNPVELTALFTCCMNVDDVDVALLVSPP
jgi:hypothetical protein